MSAQQSRFGRQQAHALLTMNVRTVLIAGTVRLVSRPPDSRGPAASLGPRFQPRDGHGRFVPYRRLGAALGHP